MIKLDMKNFFAPRTLTRDLFAVANFLVFIC